MEVTLAHLISKPEDFKVCEECGEISWHEVKECPFCGSKRLRPMTEEDAREWEEWMREVAEQGEHICEECVIEVGG